MKTRALPSLVLLIAILMLPAWSAAFPPGGGKGLASAVKLKGKDLWGPGPKGHRFAAIKDIVVAGDGKSTYLVLSRGSAFGNYGRIHLIPWQAAAPKIEKRGVRIAFDEKVVDQSPALPRNEWQPAFVTPGYIEEVSAYYRRVMQQQSK
ncbi:MAG: hypothetical protein M0017_11630 [Desulfobacteraceae bacterium]|nr:hypothetical protein [Desulfobacteraceae bacterium]